MILDLAAIVSQWLPVETEEAGLYAELVHQTGGDVIELAADPAEVESELDDAQLEAMVADLVADDEEGALYRQLEGLTGG